MGPGPEPVLGVPMSCRNRPALDEEEGVTGVRDEVCGVVGVSDVGMFGVVMLRPPHLIHLGVSPAADVAEVDGRELTVLLFLPLRRGW